MSASFACVTALSASVPLPSRRSDAKRKRLVERAPREAERRRADRHPEQVQRLHADAEAFAGLADDRIGGMRTLSYFRRASGCGAMTSIRSSTLTRRPER